jgi:hypothetical protein
MNTVAIVDFYLIRFAQILSRGSLSSLKIPIPGSIIESEIKLHSRFQRKINESFPELEENLKSIPIRPMGFQKKTIFLSPVVSRVTISLRSTFSYCNKIFQVFSKKFNSNIFLPQKAGAGNLKVSRCSLNKIKVLMLT